MEAFLKFFETLPIYYKLVWLIGLITLFWILEGYYSFLKSPYDKWKHAQTNLALLSFTMIINVAFGLLTAGVFIFLEQNSLGVLNYVSLPIWLELGISLLVLDLVAQYGIHFLLHKSSVLWRLHTVHHSDTFLDVTSGTRHHPLDFMLREFAALIAVVITGMPIGFYLIYRIITVFFTYWSHANISLPKKLDKTLSYLIVTPVMHKFHHHDSMPITDTNFGNILSIWDHIFGTYYYGDSQNINYGLDIVDSKRSNDLKYQLGLPFNKTIQYKNKEGSQN
ncbi:sterol desaturase family protein [Nonlabens tegetincola]|uniref:sterol desaturase family protein n=1 Tax=Nonlabens tegetincola TaxID=323273 RepID=UPI000CF4598A|nr:sterol desaturase family protein [Nonlabens tegetincola]PQJ14127.1 sterol desaturase [Nonlabens tegetincola]